MIFVYTPEERALLQAISDEARAANLKLGEIRKEYGKESPEFKAAKEKHRKEDVERQQAFSALIDELEEKRFAQLTTPAQILEDAKQQARDAIPYAFARIWKDSPIFDGDTLFIIDMSAGGLYIYPLGWDYERIFLQRKNGDFDPKDSRILLDATGMITYIMRDVISRHIAALKGKPEGEQLREAIAAIVAASPYTIDDTPEKAKILKTDSAIFKANMPMYHGKAADALAALSNKDAAENTIADRAIFQTSTGDGEYKIVIQDFSKLKGKLSVNTHKLLSTGIAEFTQINNYGGGEINPTITIPLKEYARLLGYEVDERETDSPEEAAKEKKRAAEALKTAKKRIRQDLELLQAMRWTWQEKVKGQAEDFASILLLERIAIRKGYIIMEFGRNMANYLKRLPLTQYPQGLLSIDARSETAYRLGLKMAEHYNMDKNQLKGNANRLKVSTLLAVTGLPTYEALQQESHDNSRHWELRIKEPFETALDRITGKVISSWEYVKAKGEPLTTAEAYGIEDYEVFADLLVQFEMVEAPDHKDRLKRRAEEKKQAATKKKKGSGAKNT